jgi:hypothetical protein
MVYFKQTLHFLSAQSLLGVRVYILLWIPSFVDDLVVANKGRS